jgi:2-dehydro-3-deoxyphosphogluconate aldolase/(4S)-4-hydroxy-2-oxoglutarate aldolase
MNKLQILERLLHPGIIAILRADSSAQMLRAAEALYAGGVTAMEVTMTTPGALDLIREVNAAFSGRILMGVGSVLDPETCRSAILAGADFVVTPIAKLEVIKMCNRYSKPIACGAFTPTEALLAHESGADLVKIFPADAMGPAYIRSLLAPMPMLRLLPTGGVTPENAGEFLRAGAVALGVGSGLVSSAVLKGGDWEALTAVARRFVGAVEGC